MTRPAGAPASCLVPEASGHVWHPLSADQVLQAFSDKTFTIATGVSVLTLILATVLGPFQKFLSTTSLDLQQWLICTGLALSIIVVSEIRKAIRRRTAAGTVQAGQPAPSLVSAAVER